MTTLTKYLITPTLTVSGTDEQLRRFALALRDPDEELHCHQGLPDGVSVQRTADHAITVTVTGYEQPLRLSPTAAQDLARNIEAAYQRCCWECGATCCPDEEYCPDCTPSPDDGDPEETERVRHLLRHLPDGDYTREELREYLE